MTDSELNQAIRDIEQRLIAGVESTTTDGTSIKYGSTAEARAELRRLKRMRDWRSGCASKRGSMFKETF